MTRLRQGDLVEVLPAAQILATLDDAASLESVPFMPEMLGYVGKRFHVSHRVEKICDTAGGTIESRRMRGTVMLEDLRCDGSGHDGCQAGCRLYWKEAWLRRVDGEPTGSDSAGDPSKELEARSRAATRTTRVLDGERLETYRCQATEASSASEPMSRYDVRQYVRDVRSGNVGLPRMVRVLGRAAWFKLLRTLRLRSRLPHRPCGGAIEAPTLDLRIGELAQIRSQGEIEATLDDDWKHRGLGFGYEMMPYCGGVYRVQDRVRRLIDDRTGQMIEISRDCLILEGVVCTGEDSIWRWFCPRAIYPYWREAWLRRAEEPHA